ncbi:hypothetical protein L3Y34_016395 [Caenorhabditis briggsae]|uniref:Uncharacterized protein n=1 Tax=Caenorhabditis briggsae TaxID=6238 RepID=A0AAE9DX57_CAEBR|nr:hypothetical protein L3Y34_016395 [Caenorhabditis briggsae]
MRKNANFTLKIGSTIKFLAHLEAEIESFEVFEVRDADNESTLTVCVSPKTSNAYIAALRRLRKLILRSKLTICIVFFLHFCLRLSKFSKAVSRLPGVLELCFFEQN